MKDNGTDRDIALQLADAVENIAQNLERIEHNLYGVYIFVQPVDAVDASIGDTVTFSVVANNVTEYQWQSKRTTTWNDTTLSGSKTASISPAVTEDRVGVLYRCKLTGIDGTVTYTDEVRIILAE